MTTSDWLWWKAQGDRIASVIGAARHHRIQRQLERIQMLECELRRVRRLHEKSMASVFEQLAAAQDKELSVNVQVDRN